MMRVSYFYEYSEEPQICDVLQNGYRGNNLGGYDPVGDFRGQDHRENGCQFYIVPPGRERSGVLIF